MHIDSPPRWRRFIADTAALLVFFTMTGALNERFVAGMSWPEVGLSRAIGAPLMVLTAQPYGLWRDAVMRRWAAAGDSTPRAFLSDTFALATFQVPLYTLIIWMGGADGSGLAKGVLGTTVVMVTCGRPYGVWLDLVRRWFGLRPA